MCIQGLFKFYVLCFKLKDHVDIFILIHNVLIILKKLDGFECFHTLFLNV